MLGLITSVQGFHSFDLSQVYRIEAYIKLKMNAMIFTEPGYIYALRKSWSAILPSRGPAPYLLYQFVYLLVCINP